jgi:N-acetylmuramoyl-L-alanine amidase
MTSGFRCRGRAISTSVIVAGATLGLSILPIAAVAATVTSIRASTSDARTRIVLDLDRSTSYTHRTLPTPPRIVVELADGVFASGVDTRSVPGGYVKRVRTNALRSGRVQAVLDLTRVLDYTIFTLDNPPRIVVDVKHAGAPEDQPASTDTAKNTETPKNTDSPKNADTAKNADTPKNTDSSPRTDGKAAKETPPPAQKTKPAETADAAPPARGKRPPVRINPPSRDTWVVAIDAGHGGDDTGARHHRTSEKDVTLDLARVLKTELEKFPGIKPVLVRKGDYYIPLRRRWTLAEKQGADLFVSLHCNASLDKDAAGTEVFFLSLKGATDEAAVELAKFENAVDAKMGIETPEADLDAIIFDMQQTDVMTKSQILAEACLDHLYELGTVYSRGVKQAGFAVLKSPRMPSILVEAAFISHRDEVKLLRDPGWREEFGRRLAQGIADYVQSVGVTEKASLEKR